MHICVLMVGSYLDNNLKSFLIPLEDVWGKYFYIANTNIKSNIFPWQRAIVRNIQLIINNADINYNLQHNIRCLSN